MGSKSVACQAQETARRSPIWAFRTTEDHHKGSSNYFSDSFKAKFAFLGFSEVRSWLAKSIKIFDTFNFKKPHPSQIHREFIGP
jgi:hypothetical protein